MWQSVKGQYTVNIIFLIYRAGHKKIVMYNKVARCGSAEAIVMHFTKRQKYLKIDGAGDLTSLSKNTR